MAAAKTIKGITVEIDGKATGLSKVLDEVTTKSTKLSGNLKEVNKLLKLDPTNTTLLAEKQKILGDSIAVTKQKLQDLESVQDQVKQQYKDGTIDQGAYLAFQEELVRTQDRLKQLTDEQKEFGSVAKQTLKEAGESAAEFFGKIEKAGENVQDAGKKVSDLGGNVTKGVSAPIVAAGTAMVAAFKSVDDGVDIIVKATGASGDALDGLVDSYKNVATTVPTDLANVANAIGEVNTRFQSTGPELERQTELFLKFSEITGGDVVQSVDTADKVMEAWGKSAKDLDGFLGMVAKASQDTGINAQSLMQSVQANSASFKELGFSLEESIGFMAQMDANGVDASAALGGLKKSVTNLTEAGMDESEALKQVIDSIKNASTETQALQIAQETFGTKGAAEMATAIREGRIDLDALSGSMGEYSTVVQDTYANTVDGVDSFQTAGNAAKIAMAEFGQTISDMLAPVLAKITEIIKSVTERLRGMDDGQKKTIVTIGLLVAAIGPVISIIGGVISTVGTAISVFGALGKGLSLLATGPVGIIVLAITGIVTALVVAYNKCDWFREKVDTIFGGIKDFIKNTMDKIATFFDFEWSLPHIKLPHFRITGSLSLSPPSVPKLSVDWYAKGGILKAPTIFGALGDKFLGGGEAGDEAVLPLSSFYTRLEALFAKYRGGSGGVIVNFRIDNWENSSGQDLEDISDIVAQKIYRKIEEREAALS